MPGVRHRCNLSTQSSVVELIERLIENDYGNLDISNPCFTISLRIRNDSCLTKKCIFFPLERQRSDSIVNTLFCHCEGQTDGFWSQASFAPKMNLPPYGADSRRLFKDRTKSSLILHQPPMNNRNNNP
jgi:hypothetical protein